MSGDELLIYLEFLKALISLFSFIDLEPIYLLEKMDTNSFITKCFKMNNVGALG